MNVLSTRRVAIVTGAARGIGRGSAVALANAGYDVAGLDAASPVADIPDLVPASAADLTETGRLVESSGAAWLALAVDQRDRSGLREAFERVRSAFGGFDVLHANAGIQSFVPLAEMSDTDWDDTIEVNLTGTANVLRAAIPFLKARGGGRIIITSSTQGQHGTLNAAAYSASKWGLLGLMKSAALELGPSASRSMPSSPGSSTLRLLDGSRGMRKPCKLAGPSRPVSNRTTNRGPYTHCARGAPSECHGSSRMMSHRRSSSWHRRRHGWSRVPPSPSQLATVRTSPPDTIHPPGNPERRKTNDTHPGRRIRLRHRQRLPAPHRAG